jgi:UDP-N-acetylmuramoyl-L-alanyl-D-glutamate--2,6-diaminopimelate ligase
MGIMPGKYKLSQLLSGLEGILSYPRTEVEVLGVAMDSRQVQPGVIFIALGGSTTDGHLYIGEAIERGAVAVVGEKEVPDISVPYVQVKDGRKALAHLSAGLFGFPAHKLMMIGVTGTDGKTTTCNLIHQILLAAGLRSGMISTVNAVIDDQVMDTGFHVTTPDAPIVQSYLSQMVAAGLTHVILEATSHGLAQRRVAACEFDMALVTNITHEHLDYHGSFEAYQAAKGLLFSELSNTSPKIFNSRRAAVLNKDDRSFDYLSDITRVPILTYGAEPGADVTAKDIRMDSTGLKFTVLGTQLDGRMLRIPIESSLVGKFNLYNILAAVALTAGAMDLDPQAVRAGVAALKSVPGRMESIDLGQNFKAIVDFAHTPNALRRSLQAARTITSGRVIAVFGSAGLRDREKRRMMAKVSSELAEFTVLTAEDPRTESLEEILHEMALGAENAGGTEGETFWRIPDRGDAIRFAIRLAAPGDLVISCGKGHEQSMCFGETEYPWDDRVAFQAALAEFLDVVGPEMPFLPRSAS